MMLQKPVRASGEDITIGEYFSRTMGHIFEIDKEANTLNSKLNSWFVVNGIEIEDSMSLGWLVMNMASIDNFLYITVILK